MENQFVTLTKAAEKFCVHVATLRRWIRDGRVPATKIGRRYLIPLKVFEDLADKGGERPPSQDPKAFAAPGPLELQAPLELLPVWLQFSPHWYRRLYLVSSRCSLTASETLTQGIELVLKQHTDNDKLG